MSEVLLLAIVFLAGVAAGYAVGESAAYQRFAKRIKTMSEELENE